MQLYVMREIPTWDQYYLDICKVVATRSKDPNTQIGCVIIGPNHEIRSTGYNSFPRGIRDDVPERLVRPTAQLDPTRCSPDERRRIHHGVRKLLALVERLVGADA